MKCVYLTNTLTALPGCRFFLMYLINKDETEHTGQVRDNNKTEDLNVNSHIPVMSKWDMKQEKKKGMQMKKDTGVSDPSLIWLHLFQPT